MEMKSRVCWRTALSMYVIALHAVCAGLPDESSAVESADSTEPTTRREVNRVTVGRFRDNAGSCRFVAGGGR
jgi:hypothetical protein